MLPFDIVEYQERLEKTKRRMEAKGVEVLLLTDPANINYLSGYDAWSFYVHQALVVIIDEPQPIWIGRHQDASGARSKTWIYDENIIDYPDYYVQSETYHPMAFMGEILKQIGHGNRTVGVEMDHYYFSAKAYQRLIQSLPDATFKDASLLVNEIRLIKSDQEIEYMKRAAIIAEKAMSEGVKTIRPDVRECDTAANIYYHIASGTPEYGGDYPAIVPLLPSGENTSTPHLTWSERTFQEGDSVIIELAGCYKRYHVPLARTVSVGQPTDMLQQIAPFVIEGMNEVFDAVKPGMTCGEVEEVWRNKMKKRGVEKEARLGYSVGLNYPPDWGEHTASLRAGDSTILQPNMTFHFIPALWYANYGIEISETFRVTEEGCESFTTYPRELIINDPFQIDADGKIS
ncbi:M24 family metallopeptidase [Texcoconibacillus texcoconensis]|uniref:Xaa-Pro dipeptidase n=1 Tax=Texcoconibacillus texcoconensis TaxID=1095777 RepID=A0A840QS46_9BACI|nr:M24 family metallopeptidase [Texcoconibacillus texcoconensis]MBB5174184.1 Xaa-Pro dipeptidase [Texcoconibacillus texcoconensis]